MTLPPRERLPLPAVLTWTLQQVARHIERFGHRLTESAGRLDDLFVSAAEARRIIAAAGPSAPDTPPATSAPPVGPVVAHLAERLSLDALDLRLWMLAAAPALDVDVARLYTFAWADFAVKLPSAGFLCELATGDHAAARAALARLERGAPLVRAGLVRVTAADAWAPDPPILHRAVTCPSTVLAWLRGVPMDAGPASTTLEVADRPASAWLPDGVGDRLRALLGDALGGERIRLLLAGPAGAGRLAALHRVAADWGRGVVSLSLARALDEPDPEAAVAEACRVALLDMRVLAVRWGALGGDRVARRVLARLADHAGVLVVLAEQPTIRLERALEPLLTVQWPLPTSEARMRMWRDGLGATVTEADLPQALATRFEVLPGDIDAASAAARRRYRLDGVRPSMPGVATALAARLRQALDGIAEPVGGHLTWDDVVLPDDVRATLLEIESQARHRELVFDRWGFRGRMEYGHGLACLFSGPPGTGKTMMAGVIARRLGRPMYRVDLARVVSKWVGETEKNLARVFDEAQRARVILLFDEADSLFAKRTEVRGANDRFANMEVNYLLQRMEAFDGMSILTTNFERGLDQAFKRRLRFRVHFPMPDAEQRAELWQRMLPSAVPTTGDMPWRALARRYKMSGGSIRNAVLRAAFYAAEGQCVLDATLLRRAAEAEMHEMGHL